MPTPSRKAESPATLYDIRSFCNDSIALAQKAKANSTDTRVHAEADAVVLTALARLRETMENLSK